MEIVRWSQRDREKENVCVRERDRESEGVMEIERKR